MVMEALTELLSTPNPLPVFVGGVVLAVVSAGALKFAPLLPWLGDDEDDDDEDGNADNEDEKDKQLLAEKSKDNAKQDADGADETGGSAPDGPEPDASNESSEDKLRRLLVSAAKSNRNEGEPREGDENEPHVAENPSGAKREEDSSLEAADGEIASAKPVLTAAQKLKQEQEKMKSMSDNEVLRMKDGDEEKFLAAFRKMLPYTDEAVILREY